MVRGWLAAIFAICLMLGTAHADAESFAMEVPGEIRPFKGQELHLTLPAGGALRIEVQDGYGEQLPALEAAHVRGGACSIPYDGCSFAGMPLRPGACTFTVRLWTDGGKYMELTKQTRVGYPAAVLEYALPRSSIYYQEQTKSFQVDCGVSGGGKVYLDIFTDEQLQHRVARMGKTVSQRGVFSISWRGKLDQGTAVPGTYWCRVMMKDQPERSFVFPLTVVAGAPPEESICQTGGLLPWDDSHEALMEKLEAPLVVVDIEATDHQKIYARPSKKSEVLGKVHGQSQGLDVLETGESFTLVGVWRHEDGAYIEGYVPTEVLKVVRPHGHYGVVIDKPRQELRVYERGQLVGSMRISTGLMDQGKLFRETRAGAFITTEHLPTFESHDYTYLYPIRIDGGNLIHQMGFLEPKKGGFANQLTKLGQKASEGCVRMDYRTDETHAINAYWMWTHLEWGTKVLVLDDQAQREARMEALGA